MKKIALIAVAAMAVSSAAVAAPSDKAEPAAVTIPALKPGMGQIVLFRPSSMGFAIKCTVRENGAMVGRVGAGKYYVFDVAPGTHNFTAKSEATDTVAVQVEADETSYVKCGISMGVMVGRPNLSPSTEKEFAKSAKKIKPMEAEKIAAEIEKDKAALAAKSASAGN